MDEESIDAAVEALRARGAPQADPVRWRFVEAFARRAAAHDGALRRQLDARLRQVLDKFDQALRASAVAPALAAAAASTHASAAPVRAQGASRAHSAAAQPDEHRAAIDLAARSARRTAPLATASTPCAEPPARSALGDLLDRLAAQHPDTEPGAPSAIQGTRATSQPTPLPELKTLRLFPATWSRLAADQRLTQALAQVPDNAGPLHSQHLVHRALLLMREASPEYLQHFMAHVDALMWLEQAQAAHQRQERQEPPPARSASMSKPATRL